MKWLNVLLSVLATSFIVGCGGGGGTPTNTTPTDITPTDITPTDTTSTNNAPVLSSIGNQTMAEDTVKTVPLSATDADSGDTLTFSATSSAHITANVIGTVLTLTPSANWNGSENITVSVNDGTTDDSEILSITVTPVNDAPTFTSGSTVNVAENQTGAIDLNASDVEGSTLRYSISGTDSTLFNINDSTGIVTFSSAPDYEHPMDENNDNNYEFNATVTDGDKISTQHITISVTDINLNTVSLPIPQGTNLAYTSLTAHPDGSFYLSAYDSTNNIPYIVKLEENGAFDLSFGVNGFSDVSSVSSNGFENNGFVFDSFGNIYGISINGGIVKLNSNGSINLSFGTNGLYVLPGYRVSNIFIDENDWIYFSGSCDASGSRYDRFDGYIVKMNIMGIKDNNFDSDGIVHFDYDGIDAYSVGTIAKESFGYLKIDSNGNIYAFGSVTEDASYHSVLMVKYTPSGQLNVDFNGNGIVIYRSTDSSSIFMEGHELTTDDKPLVIINNSSLDSIKILRYTSLGILDNNFNGNGILDLGAIESLANLASRGKTALDKLDNLYLNTTMDRTNTEGYFIAKVSQDASYSVINDVYSHETKTLLYITINPANDELFELTADNFGTSYSVSKVLK